MKVKLSPDEVRHMMEARLRAKTVPSGKIYKRTPKHRKEATT
jgi:hypothetical protein